MSHKAARPAKKPPAGANTLDKQAATAQDHLERGRFRDAMECYKALLKTDRRPEWLAALAKAYEGRAKALAAKDMRPEAIALWRSRAEVCHLPLWEGPYPAWLIAEGRFADVLTWLSTRRAASAGKADDALAALEAQLAPGLLSADEAACQQLPAESLLAQHRPRALAALTAYARQDAAALDDALAGISFRSPYRDLRSVLKALVLWETDRDAARSAIERLPQDGPFESLAAPLRSLVAPGSERWRRWAHLNTSQQLAALDLLGCPRSLAPLLQVLSGANTDLAPAELFDLVQRNARVLPEALATSVWQWLAPWAKRRGCASPQIFGKPSKAQQECATALAVEIKGELGHAEEHWLDSVPLLASSSQREDRDRAALVLRHMASLSGEGKLDQAGAKYLAQSLEFDPHAGDIYVQLTQFWRHRSNLKMAREHLEAGLRHFPDSVALLTEAVETALAASAFKKAVSTARRLLAIDPLNRKVRSLLGNAHLSHAGKHIAAHKLESAKKEIEEARSWLGAAAEQGRLQLLLAWTEPAPSAERLRLAQLGVAAWGGGLPAGWRLLREAHGIFARLERSAALQLLGEAGIQPTKTLTPADVLGLVQVLEHEPPVARKGADLLAPWRKALLALAPAPQFDAEATLRICEALGRHREHDLLEQFATAARKRWPDRPVFVYHAVAARFGKTGHIPSERDEADLERAAERAVHHKDFKLHMRIEALFEAYDLEPDDFEDSDFMDSLPYADPQALRAMLERSAKVDGGEALLELARGSLDDAVFRPLEKACGGDQKALVRQLIDLMVAQAVRLTGQPLLDTPAKAKKPPAKTIGTVKPVTPPEGQGSLFDE